MPRPAATLILTREAGEGDRRRRWRGRVPRDVSLLQAGWLGGDGPSAIRSAMPVHFWKGWDQAMNVMSYKGYSARIEFDAEDEILVGHLIGIGDIVGFHADDAAGIRRAFEEAVDSYVDLAGESAQRPDPVS